MIMTDWGLWAEGSSPTTASSISRSGDRTKRLDIGCRQAEAS
jgi:hypothetical protein